MPDKKIINKKDVNENNPNDDEEILKNTHECIRDNYNNTDTDESKDKDDKTVGSKKIEFP